MQTGTITADIVKYALPVPHYVTVNIETWRLLLDVNVDANKICSRATKYKYNSLCFVGYL